MYNNIEKELLCNYCNSIKEVNSGGYIVCTNCGTTKQREYVDTKASLSREGGFKNKQDSIGKSIDFIGSLGSQIGFSNGYIKGSNGKKLNPNIVLKYRRLKINHHDKARLNGNATHLRTMIAFNRVFNSFNISKDIKHRSLYLYWKQVHSGVKITNHILLIALCFLQAIREAGERAPLRFSEIIGKFNQFGHRVTNKNILKLARELQVPLSPIKRKPEDYIARIASKVREDGEIVSKLQNHFLSSVEYEMLIITVSKKFLSLLSLRMRGGVQPYPFAVSIMYLSDRAIAKTLSKKPLLTQQILARIAKSAEFTIRDHVYRFLGDLYQKYENNLISSCKIQLDKNSNKY